MTPKQRNSIGRQLLKLQSERAKRRSVQRVVSRLLEQWEDIAKRKDAFAEDAKKRNNHVHADRARGIASAFRYCSARLKYEAGG